MQGTVRRSLTVRHKRGKAKEKIAPKVVKLATMVDAPFATQWTTGRTSALRTPTRARAKAISRMAKGEAKGVRVKVSQDFEL